MRILLVGAPGSGKGTQATRIAAHFGITHISSGDVLRQYALSDSVRGDTVRRYLSVGDLVPDEVVLDLLYEPVLEAARAGGYVLDGFPRNVPQARAAHVVTAPVGADLQVALFMEVPDDVLIARLLARARGKDDTREVINHRLEVFRARTIPLVEHCRTHSLLITVDGSRDIDTVSADAVSRLEAAQHTLANRSGPPRDPA